MICGALSLRLDQNHCIIEILTVPWAEWLEQLKSLGILRDNHLCGATWSLICLLSWVIPLGWEFLTLWRIEHNFAPISSNQRVLLWIEGQISCNSHGSHNLWGSHKGMCCWVGIISCCKISVERCHDRISLSLLNFSSLPLTNAWSACICQHGTAHLFKHLNQTISLDGGSDLLGSWCNRKWNLCFNSCSQSLPCHTRSSGHILI
mmetsp:Transcript_11891/g.23866  ORF Transcript_11891/g.23866 Transcript_11891/m.23866 type:complete len:205 (+) Transcript_11891:646-1260(+)